MDAHILSLIGKERVCAFSVVLPDGTSHTAAMHFSFQDQPSTFFIQTTNTSEKVKGLLNGETIKASMVIGLSEESWQTLQVRGDVRIISDPAALLKIHTIHYKKNPDAEQYKESPHTIFLEFVPTWSRYTDFNTEPETIILNG